MNWSVDQKRLWLRLTVVEADVYGHIIASLALQWHNKMLYLPDRIWEATQACLLIQQSSWDCVSPELWYEQLQVP